MVKAFGIFNFYDKNDRAFRAVLNFRHLSHFTLFEFLKLFAKKTQKLETRN